MEKAHVVLIDKIVIKFTASLKKKKVIEKFSDCSREHRGEHERIEFQQKTCQIFFFRALSLQHSPTTQYLIRYRSNPGIMCFSLKCWQSSSHDGYCWVHLGSPPGTGTAWHHMLCHKQWNGKKRARSETSKTLRHLGFSLFSFNSNSHSLGCLKTLFVCQLLPETGTLCYHCPKKNQF